MRLCLRAFQRNQTSKIKTEPRVGYCQSSTDIAHASFRPQTRWKSEDPRFRKPGDVRLKILKREMHIPDSAASNVRQIRQKRCHRIGLGAQDLLAWIIVTAD